MRNLAVVYRPYVDPAESASILSEADIHFIGKQQTAEIIKAFLGELGMIKQKNTTLIENNDSVLWYWNNGKPFLRDLIRYYCSAKKHWPLEYGGDTYDYLKEYWPIIKSCEFYKHRGKWTEAMANVHIFALLERDHFWYQRFWAKGEKIWRYHKLKDPAIFVNGKPRKLKNSNIAAETYQWT